VPKGLVGAWPVSPPHGDTHTARPAFDWDRQIIYELHVGTFTNEGTFDAIIPRLDDLKQLGITAVELLPVAQFPGDRNWGYDGVYVNAVQASYGGAAGLKRLIDAAHRRGLAVILDVVYNHLGPEGNYLSEFGPYFTDRYKTPWGLALNFDGTQSDHVRWLFVHSALMWIDEFHIDALRVDAVHAIVDHWKAQGAPIYDPSILRPRPEDGEGTPEDDGAPDELYDQAIAAVSDMRFISISLLQRKLRIGYSRAAKLMDLLEQKGYVGPDEGSPSKGREILTKGELPPRAAASQTLPTTPSPSPEPRAFESEEGFDDWTDEDWADLDKE